MTAPLSATERWYLQRMDDARGSCRHFLPPYLDTARALERVGLCILYVGDEHAPRPGLRYATITDAGRAALNAAGASA